MLFFVFFDDTATSEIYTLSLHDALPIYGKHPDRSGGDIDNKHLIRESTGRDVERGDRSEEHTSELQSHSDLVCRLLLEKKKKKIPIAVLTNLTISRWPINEAPSPMEIVR